jgi:hypothetical protein
MTESQSQARRLSARFAEDVASYLQSQGVNVKPGVEQTGSLVGLDNWHLRLSRSYRIKLSEHLPEAQATAKEQGKPFSCVVQYRSGAALADQYCVMTLETLSGILKALEGI